MLFAEILKARAVYNNHRIIISPHGFGNAVKFIQIRIRRDSDGKVKYRERFHLFIREPAASEPPGKYDVANSKAQAIYTMR